MGKLNPLYESHIGKVEVSFCLSAPHLGTSELSDLLKILPDSYAKRGDKRKNRQGLDVPGVEEKGYWILSSKGRINSKDINDHFGILFHYLLPVRHEICNFLKSSDSEAYFDVFWESSYLYAGTGPILSDETVKNVSELNASIAFDIYQID